MWLVEVVGEVEFAPVPDGDGGGGGVATGTGDVEGGGAGPVEVEGGCRGGFEGGKATEEVWYRRAR